jgi:hypothetical protein
MPRGRGKFSNHRYGTVHQYIRRRFAPKVRAGLIHCWRCGKLIPPGSKFDLGHLPNGDRYPEHVACNRATMTHLKQQLAEQQAEQQRGSRQW